MFNLTILGCNSALPAYGRNPTAQVLQTNDSAYLIDCGEGTQSQFVRYKLKRANISHIFISHLHGDHYFGLIGLISSMGLLCRTTPLHIHGPALLKEIIDLHIKVSETRLPFDIHFHPLGEDGIIADDDKVIVESFRVEHRIACWGFLFRQKKKPRKILPDRTTSYGVPHTFFSKLQMGEDYINPKGTIVPNEELTTASSPAKSYAYCADTVHSYKFIERIKNTDLLYHEATYLSNAIDKALHRYHSTAAQAADIALKSGAKKLIIGHFSSRYEVLDELLKEAKEVFENTELAVEGSCFEI